jgi:CHAD domain-containing protein
MPQFDKLLTDVGPDDPPARVAHRALKVRLRAVVKYLDQADAASDQQAEEIHQLRVWTRRSAAALKLFGPLLAPRKARKLKKVLRRLRRSAGAVRDLDVIETQLGDALPGPLADRLKDQRDAAQRDLRAACRKWGSSGKLKRRVKRLLEQIDDHHQSNGVSFGPWCRAQLTPLVAEFASHAARGARQSDAGLHRWRLAVKRLRYALELAVTAMPKRTWSRLYKLLTDVQERIGVICDALAERQRLKEWRGETNDREVHKLLSRLIADCRRRLSASKRQFARWWTRGRSKSAGSLCRQAVGAT